jgi:hypothetical protein
MCIAVLEGFGLAEPQAASGAPGQSLGEATSSLADPVSAVAAPTVPRADDGLSLELMLVLAAVAAMTVGQGGFYRRVGEMSGAFFAVSAGVLVWRRRLSNLHPTLWALSGLGVLGVCTAVAGAFDGPSTRPLAPIALLAALAVGAAVVGSSSERLRCQLADGVIVLCGFLAVTAWIGVAFRISPLGHPDGGLWRAATTVTYANAAAAVFGAVCLWSIARRTTSDGMAPRAVSVLVATGLIATLSRAGLASFAVGLLVLALLLGFGRVWRTAARPMLGAAIAAAALIPGIEASGSAKPLWAGFGLIAGLLVGISSPRRVLDGRETAGHRPRLLRLGFLGLALAGVIAGAVVLASARSGPWTNRLSVASPDRGSLTSVALHMWKTHLLTGVGPDRDVFVWMTPARQELFDRYAHDEYLQLAVEEGALGLLGLGALAAGVAVTARKGWRSDTRRAVELTALRAGAIAGLACFALQSGFDFLWHVPVVPTIAAVGVGFAALLPPGDEMS